MSIAGENGIVLDSAVLGTLLRALIRVRAWCGSGCKRGWHPGDQF